MKDTKRQNFPPGLWVIATPIGNLADFSPRARMALEEAEWILCEDTRRSLNLLRALGLEAEGRLKRLDAHTEQKASSYWVDRLKEGASIALVSDAGTPAVSDPGAVLVSEAVQAGIRVTPIPGPSAVMALLSASGFQECEFTFRGFFPRKQEQQRQELQRAAQLAPDVSPIWIWFESPHRIRSALEQVSVLCPEVGVSAGKELTKVHEKIFYGTGVQVFQQVCAELEQEGEIGEWCFALCFQKKQQSQEVDPDHLAWVAAVKCLLTAEISPSETARIVSQQFGISKKICYREVILQSQYKKNAEGG